jgi:hypothetical protein
LQIRSDFENLVNSDLWYIAKECFDELFEL